MTGKKNMEIQEIVKARSIISNQIRNYMKLDRGKDEFTRLCIIAGELDVLIKILKNDRNK